MSEQPIPEQVIEALARVRETATTNMLDRQAVLHIARGMGRFEACDWLNDNEGRYMDALNAMGERSPQIRHYEEQE